MITRYGGERRVGRAGRLIRVLKKTPPVRGSDLTLHVDYDLQKIAHDQLAGRRGAIVAIDPNTGGVLAFVSNPTFDPNAFVGGIPYKLYAEYRALLEKHGQATLGKTPWSYATYADGRKIALQARVAYRNPELWAAVPRPFEASDAVSIMTLHSAKGLEFDTVFLPGWEEGLFPSQRTLDESGRAGLEEERRLAYVGITRAEELCTISFASNRRVYGQWQSQLPSRFIDELPAAHVDVLTPPGLMGGGYGAAAGFGFSSGLEERVTKADVYNSPGWRRLQDRSAARPVSQPREARHMTIDAAAISAYRRWR